MKTKKLIIIDGYNILNAWEKYKPFLNLSFENAAAIGDDYNDQKLLNAVKMSFKPANAMPNLIANYTLNLCGDLLLVFDAYKINFKGTSEVIKGIEVVYTKQNETADQYIEKKLDEIGRKILVSVGTDDTLIQKLVTQRGGIVLTAKELLFRYENLKNKSNRYETKNRITNKSYFNTLDDKAINQLDEIEKKLFGK